jgi:hypothetical protein
MTKFKIIYRYGAYSVCFVKFLKLQYAPSRDMILYDYNGSVDLSIRLTDADICLDMQTGLIEVDCYIRLHDNYSVSELDSQIRAHIELGWACDQDESETIKELLTKNQ